MKEIALQVGFALPIYVVIRLFIGAELAFYEVASVGIISSMISGLWLKLISTK